MLRRRRRSATSAALTADERAYVDRAVHADIDAYANELALHLGAAFDDVRDVLRADLEARATLLGDDAPYARDFYPAGSLPPMPETTTERSMRPGRRSGATCPPVASPPMSSKR